MTFIQSELDKIARNFDHFHFPKCVGRDCIGRLNEDVAIKISFKAMQSSGIYNALQIRLINRVGGDIDTQLILPSRPIESQPILVERTKQLLRTA